ncbi:MAG: glutamate--cysteine ligase [Gammaproteobacteria bacterium]
MSNPSAIAELKGIEQADLMAFRRGIEREALRVMPSGALAMTPHPDFLGSKLTHPKITTDFSESQLELITPVHTTAAAALDDLDKVHRFIYTGLENEILWSASMPCVLADNPAIPLAYYGESNIARLKTTYRNGLGYRYGRAMQTICAVHYNFSLPPAFWQWLKSAESSTESDQDFKTRRYFDLMRNFRRWSWLLTYLFGASPAVCNSFVRGREHTLQPWDEGTSYLPGATSLRSGNLGYQSDAQADHMQVCYNSLASYVGSLASAICEPYAAYGEIGTKVGDDYRQINDCILQSEAEFYSSIRAKRVPGKGQNFLASLMSDGVEYIEVRLLDVNPYLPLGIDAAEIHFLDAFLLYCLLSPSPEHTPEVCGDVRVNTMRTVHEGRNPDLTLLDQGNERSLREWAQCLLADMAPVVQELDRLAGSDHYQQALTVQAERIADDLQTPSGAIIEDMRREGVPFFRFAMNEALAHREYFRSRPLDATDIEAFETMAAQSQLDQQAIEATDAGHFDDYLADVLSQYQLLAS